MFKRVVIPLDGSPLAEGILPFILKIAGPLDMEVLLVRVVEPQVPEVLETSRHVKVDDMETLMGDAEEYLRVTAALLAKRGLRVRTATRRGRPVDEIIAAAREHGADLIAMTTHGRSGLGRLLFGSVAEAVLRQSDRPVFLMKLTERQAEIQEALR